MKNKLFVLALLSTGMLFTACNGGENVDSGKASVSVVQNVAVDGITLDNETLSLDAGYTAQLTALVTPEGAANKKVVWTSANEQVATVDDTGLVTGVNFGETVITATTEDGNYTATCDVSVNGYHVSRTVFTNIGKIENNAYNGKNYEIDATHADYMDIKFTRNVLGEWDSVVLWYDTKVAATSFEFDIELVKGDLPSFLYEFGGELNFKSFERVALTKGARITHKANITGMNIKTGEEGNGSWGCINLEFNNPLDSSDTYRTAENNEVVLRIHKMGMMVGEGEAPAKISNLHYDETKKQLIFNKERASSEYEIEVYKGETKLTLDQAQTRFTGVENIPNMLVAFTPKKDENFALVKGSYKARVRAKNSIGEGEWSDYAEFTIGEVSTSTYKSTGFTNNGVITNGQWNNGVDYTITPTEQSMDISFTGSDVNTWASASMTFDKNGGYTKFRVELEVKKGNISKIGFELADWAASDPEASDGKQQHFFDDITTGRITREFSITTNLSLGLGQLNIFLNCNGAAIGEALVSIYSIELLKA